MLMRHPQAHSRTASDVPMTEAQVVRKMNQRKSARKAEDSIRRQAGAQACFHVNYATVPLCYAVSGIVNLSLGRVEEGVMSSSCYLVILA